MNTMIMETSLAAGQRLQLVQGDITLEKTDAIVNAANRYLHHGGGVAGAIVRRGGQTIQKESDEWVEGHGMVESASPAWTSGGNLPARYVIHAVGPVWGEGDEEKRLSEAVTGSLRTADELKVESVSIPAISTGIFGFPRQLAATVILTAVRDYFQEHEGGLKLVKIVINDEGMIKTFAKAWHDHIDPQP
jgi:putative ATPase